MITGFNYVLLFLVAMICFGLYAVKYDSQQTERAVSDLRRQIEEEHAELRVLQAEWALRTEPGRLQRLTEQYLDLGPVRASQIISLNALPLRRPPGPTRSLGIDRARLDRGILLPPLSTTGKERR